MISGKKSDIDSHSDDNIGFLADGGLNGGGKGATVNLK